MSEKLYCMVLRMNIDCDGCYKRIRRALLHMHEDLDSHWIEKKESKVTVCGSFDPQAFAIKMRSLTNRRVEILQTTELPHPSAAAAAQLERGAAATTKPEDAKGYNSDGNNSSNSAAAGNATNKKKKKKKKKKKVQFDT